MSAIDWKKGAADVMPFLERPNEVALLTYENLEKLLGNCPINAKGITAKRGPGGERM
jgi:hypothetical protein